MVLKQTRTTFQYQLAITMLWRAGSTALLLLRLVKGGGEPPVCCQGRRPSLAEGRATPDSVGVPLQRLRRRRCRQAWTAGWRTTFPAPGVWEPDPPP